MKLATGLLRHTTYAVFTLVLKHVYNKHVKQNTFPVNMLKDVRAHCYCASLLRTQIYTPRHASSARAKK